MPAATTTTTTTPDSRGQLAYAAYCRAVGFKSKEGNDLPNYENLGVAQRNGWIAAADLIWTLATTGKAVL